MKTGKPVFLMLLTLLFPIEMKAQDPRAEFHSPLAEAWYKVGDYFEWTSTVAGNDGAQVSVFYRTFGDPNNPQLLMLHGFPNSSFDYYRLIPLLQNDYYIAVLDFPGSGFSDKPLDGFSYMLEDNARLVDHFVREVIDFDDFALYTHDRGVSIGLSFLGLYLDNPNPDYTINYHFLSNSGMYLPLASLVPFQLALLDAEAGPAMIARRRARPRLTEGDPQDVAYSDIFAFNDGDTALLHVGRYLLERQVHEQRWLNNLPRSPVPVAYLWGLQDTVNPVRISQYVWMNYLNERVAPSSYWLLPLAAHYPQRESPEAVAKIVRLALEGQLPDREGEADFMREYAANREASDAVFVGHTSVRDPDFPSSIEYTPEGYRVVEH
ncbi:MAG: alpha/beta hydrolase [Gammaproteobacteria bacterium]|nr:alpha/beta hydrolase [Gammaproteobacteria bacterium]|tara:strand:- start:6905 stop:8041 length:1137 start_codon:yes stop_codon:yes gene_type:complete